MNESNKKVSKKRITTYINVELWKDLRIKAIQQGLKVPYILEELIKNYLNGKIKIKK